MELCSAQRPSCYTPIRRGGFTVVTRGSTYRGERSSCGSSDVYVKCI
uniref:Uncharacterized protein n=1 Tax=Brassica campestris TaxID=3711 RepID=A0A3P6BNY2_BRACM|nr:unnamed protein product [Brassica rapa]